MVWVKWSSRTTALDVCVVTIDFALNVIWLVLGASALLATRYARTKSAGKRLSTFRLVSVVVVLAALFPYISALDDTLQLAQLRSETSTTQRVEQRSQVGHSASELVWLFESLNDVVTADPETLSPRFAESTVTAEAGAREMNRPAVPSKGRDPPSA
jgi:hypothetical protein